MPIRVTAQGFIELTDELALLGAELHGRLDHHPAEQIAARPAAHRLHTFVLQPKRAPRLRLRGHLDCDLAVERWHDDRAAERRGRKADRHLAAQMLTVALEERMLVHLHFDIEVTGRATVSAGLAFAGGANAIASVYAARSLDGELAGATHATLAEAGIAGVAHDRAGTAAARAGLLQLKEALRNAHVARAAAGVAGGGRAALGGAGAMAGLALGKLRHFG